MRKFQTEKHDTIKVLEIWGCAENLGMGYSALTKWLKDFWESGSQNLTSPLRWFTGSPSTAFILPITGAVMYNQPEW